MMTVKALLSALRATFPRVDVKYVHPLLYVLIVDERFALMDEASRWSETAGRLAVAGWEFAQESISEEVALVPVTEAEARDQYDFVLEGQSSDHWLPLFDEKLREEWSQRMAARPEGSCRAIHFYGFKGGQARSTVLGMLARSLAESGFRVLLVDADVEAPSLAKSFSVASSNMDGSLLGISRGLTPEPTPIETLKSGGSIHVISAAPAVAGLEMDYASFVLRTVLDTGVLGRVTSSIRQKCEGNYDFVLFDHRTGLSTTVLPVISEWPGSVVVNIRSDGMTHAQGSVISTLLAANKQAPGVFVCFSLDPDKRTDSFTSSEKILKEELLSHMAEAVARGADSDYVIGPDDLGDHFQFWYHDRAFLEPGIPPLNRISRDNAATIQKIREALAVPLTPAVSRAASQPAPARTGAASPSGARDAGWFVETPDCARLLQERLPSTYILGRKGTGKTRLFREICERKLASSLHSAADLNIGGMQAQSAVAVQLLSRVGESLESYWWTILGVSLQSEDPMDCKAGIESLLAAPDFAGLNAADVAQVARGKRTRFFAIDGIETAVEAAKTTAFVESLFRFLSTLQNDPVFSETVRFRLFIRSDLPVGVQNIEQQIHARTVQLRWDESSIFHYVLAEIARTAWFRGNFSDVCEEIDEKSGEVRSGSLSPDEYVGLLLRVFPQKLRRNNLSTMTFLRTYFSDAAGEGDSRSSFYPRVFGAFLARVAEIGERGGSESLDQDGRVSHGVVLEAFEQAAREFINEVRQELSFALDLNATVETNAKLVSDLLQSFGGLQTPFTVDKCVAALQERMPLITNPTAIRESLRRMKEMGIFEEHPGDPTKWRAGRLFKEGLRMKYVR